MSGWAWLAAAALALVALGFGWRVLQARLAGRAAARPAARPLVFRGGGEREAAVDVAAVQVPGYQLLARVGGGGMATVYRARRERDGAMVALKLPLEAYLADDNVLRRFQEEAALLARFDHPNVVRLLDHGSVGLQPFMALAYVDGESLETLIEQRLLSLPAALQVMQQLGDALAHIHARGVVHRDVKPGNVVVGRALGALDPYAAPLAADAVKLMDFGIAAGRSAGQVATLGSRVGTPVYMAPEQARGLAVDHRADIYALGLVCYELLTGQPAFRGASEVVVHQQIFQLPPSPRHINPATPAALDALVMRMIAKEPSARPSLTEVQAALQAATADDAGEAVQGMRLVLAVQARQATVRVLDTQGNLLSSFGDVGAGDAAFAAVPAAIAFDRDGFLYAVAHVHTSSGERRLRLTRRAPDGREVSVLETAGDAAALLRRPIAVACAPDRSVLVLDAETHMLLRYSAGGAFMQAFGGRGAGRGRFEDPRSLQVGGDGKVYVLDYGNRQVQRLHADGSFDTRWAFRASADDQGQRLIDGFHLDARGNLYLSDAQTLKVRMIDALGALSTVFTLPPEARGREGLLEVTTDHRGWLYSVRRGEGLIRKHRPDGSLAGSLMAGAPVVQMLGVVDAA